MTESVTSASSSTATLTATCVASLLGEAIDALTSLDCNRLEAIERKASALATAENEGFVMTCEAWAEANIQEVMSFQRLLGTVLGNTKLNLEVLHGLRRRSRMEGDAWVR